MRSRLLALLAALMALVLLMSPAVATADGGAPLEDCADAAADSDDCPIDLSELLGDAGPAAALAAGSASDAGEAGPVRLVFFWGVQCPHCERAKPFVDALERQYPNLVVERVEVRNDAAGRERFLRTMAALGAEAAGVPTFVVGDQFVVGFAAESTEEDVRALVRGASSGDKRVEKSRVVHLPLWGPLDPGAMPLPVFTLAIGLVDGINPCAMWVLLVLLSILVHVKSRARLLLFGATFVVASGVVYFAFMVAWTQVFALVGFSRYITVGLGVVVLAMGLINLKELIWFEKGVSLMIPDQAKPSLYRRMRAIARSASLPAAFAGIVVLAFLVNLIELACTLGLPAIFTRILTLREDLSAAGRYGYLALYNVAYVLPLATIVIVYAATLHRLTMGERGAKVLKGISGVLLVAFGLVFLLAPELLQ